MNEWVWAPALIATGMILPGLLAPPADALSLNAAVDVVVAVGWTGEQCVAMNEPDPQTSHTTIIRTIACQPSGGVAVRYTAHSGEWVGVDPVEASGVAVACEVSVNGITVMEQVGTVNVSCLSRLP